MAVTDPPDTGSSRYEIRVDPAFHALFAALGAGRHRDVVVVSTDGLAVQLGWLFRAHLPWEAVTGARHHADMIGGWGAHGWAGRWLVNGSSKGIVEVSVDPPQRAAVLGIWPLRLRTLWVSLVDPDGFLSVVRDRTGGRP
jgi:hypothetical protein